MSGRIIPLRDGGCNETQSLMPWLVSGALSPFEEARARAHLETCPACKDELEIESHLRDAVASQPTAVDLAWRGFRPRLEPRGFARAPRAWIGWAIAAQFLLLVGGAAIVRAPRPATYHALGAAAAPVSANMLVMFRPEATETEMRDALGAASARIVDGPTDAGAYLLATPASARARALAVLSRRREVTVAQPIDSGSGP